MPMIFSTCIDLVLAIRIDLPSSGTHLYICLYLLHCIGQTEPLASFFSVRIF